MHFKKSPLINGLESIKKAFEKLNEVITYNFLQLHFNEEELNRIFIDINRLFFNNFVKMR